MHGLTVISHEFCTCWTCVYCLLLSIHEFDSFFLPAYTCISIQFAYSSLVPVIIQFEFDQIDKR